MCFSYVLWCVAWSGLFVTFQEVFRNLDSLTFCGNKMVNSKQIRPVCSHKTWDYQAGSFSYLNVWVPVSSSHVNLFLIHFHFLTVSQNIRKAHDHTNIWLGIYLNVNYCIRQLDRSAAFLTSDDFIRSNEIIRTKWPIH